MIDSNLIGSHTFGLIELIGVFGLILGVLGWQWVSIRRTLREDQEKRDAEPKDGA